MIVVRFAHPVSRGNRRVRVATEAEAAAVRGGIAGIRQRLRLGTITDEQANRELRRLSPLRRGRDTLRDLAAPWLARVAPGTRTHAASALAVGPLAELAGEPVEELDGRRLDRWIRALERAYADSSILWGWRLLSAIVRAAIERHDLEVQPWGDWRPPRRLDPTPRPRECATTPEQAAALLGAARELDEQSRARIASLEARIACGLMLGARSGEIAGLRWSDLDPERRRVTIARSYDRKGGKVRAAAVSAPVEFFAILDAYRARLELHRRYRADGPIFPRVDERGRPIHSAGSVLESGDVRRVALYAGLPNPERWTVHSLRASLVCLELASSGSLAHAMARARHRSIKATQAYARGLNDLSPPEPAWTLPPAQPASPRLGE